ncbi:glycine--tRNA ligase subunit beta [Teichococcus cervicalis]|uniref:Glycine--tRNA ligase beta subunit n=1 Tax=Pseudoroseomonas cervicalis ATCC 49957 TaxID=525371 RepID=D5RHE2_9PROT|nr:glycine--tRNA ligase subunit beta [Pseudoroseomonas cervicalis]EFH13282.1 glycine--tRNA ligase, beta subunit [Pseudoroseomonas cervicalis ATCC 49957]
MPELLLELFSEEIPARMQARAAEDLSRLMGEALKGAGLAPQGVRVFHGPRRLTLLAELPAATEAVQDELAGPAPEAPDRALAGFLGKLGLGESLVPTLREAAAGAGEGETVLHAEGAVTLVLRREKKGGKLLGRSARPAVPTGALLAEIIPGILRRFPWPKSMRWGGTSNFVWVRPLKRILCLFDGAVVPFTLVQGEDDGHGLRSGDRTEGHRILSPGDFAVHNFADYAAQLAARHVVLDPVERAKLVRDGVAALAAAEGVEVVPDEGLVAEVAGLVEWPVPLLGRIDDAFMDLPPELMRTTMRVNQRYFALRKPDGTAAPCFALVSNIAATDGGKAVAGGNERVLRARLSDARFFWDLDRKQALESFLPKLDSVVFHAKLGTQGQRVARLERLAAWLAPKLGADAALAARAAKLAKADLATGLVGEFPELQGIIGRYYAVKDGEDSRVAEAIAAHYRPAGPGDAVPSEPVAIAVALADKLDQLAGFFAVGEKPTGSGDPFALRRAALGIIRILRENGLRLDLADALAEAFFGFPQAVGSTAEPEFGMAVAQEAMKAGFQPDPKSAHPPMVAAFAAGLLDFLAERLRVQLRAEGERHDVLAAVLPAGGADLVRLLARAAALRGFLEGEDGANLLAASRRAANILRIEDKKDGPHRPETDAALLVAEEEKALSAALDEALPRARAALAAEDDTAAMAALATLRAPVDAFFDKVVVNDPEAKLRRNRLGLLARLRSAIDQVADFSKIEG